MRMLAKTAGRAVTGPLRTSTKDISEFIRLAKMSAQSSIRLPSWQLQLREIPDVTTVESLVTCGGTVWPPQKGEKVKTSFSLGIVHAVAKADIGQGNAALNLTKVANPFRETCKGRPLQRPQPQSELSEQQSISGDAGKYSFQPSYSHPREHRAGFGHHQRTHLKGTGGVKSKTETGFINAAFAAGGISEKVFLIVKEFL